MDQCKRVILSYKSTPNAVLFHSGTSFGSPARQAAQAFLSEMSARIHIDQRKYHAAKFDGIEGTADIKNDEWNGYCIERFRWKLATLIRDLEKAL